MPDAFALFRQWWADVPKRLGSGTCRRYRREVLNTFADLGEHPVTVPRRALERHLGELRPQHASVRRAALVDFFRWCEREGHRHDNPLEGTRVKVAVTKVRRGMTEQELWRTVFAALWMGEHGERGNGWRLAWAILAQYGLLLRPGEICSLRKANVNLNGASSCAFIVETKTGHDRVVPIVGIARVALDELMRLAPGPTLLPWGTTAYWGKVSVAAKLAGVPPEKCRPYALRHTGATHLAERGVDLRVIAEILGHRDLRHVAIYTAPSDERLRQALSKLG